ncbi:hypothetical protein CAP48_10505 [Advenella sp. S44]|nr:hypothetical protein CAP48_10505 [Advenella sp. S44]
MIDSLFIVVGCQMQVLQTKVRLMKGLPVPGLLMMELQAQHQTPMVRSQEQEPGFPVFQKRLPVSRTVLPVFPAMPHHPPGHILPSLTVRRTSLSKPWIVSY